MAEIAQSVGAILDGKVEAYPARLATARFFAAHLSNHDRDRDPVAVDVEGIGYT